MKPTVMNSNGTQIAVLNEDEVLIYDVQSALDVMATMRYEYGCHDLIVNKSAIAEAFFDLRTGLAGDILQKFINYQTRLAIVGDFSRYTSGALKDFIFESNKGQHFYFVFTVEEAIQKLK